MTGTAIVDQSTLQEWGQTVGRALRPPVWVTLTGPLGAGKSVLARAIARGLGVTADMPSPTFNLLYHHPGAQGATVIHADLYRIGSPDELDELGWDELGGLSQVVLVEWPERAASRLGQPRLAVQLEACREPHLRRLTWSVVGEHPSIPLPRPSPRPHRAGPGSGRAPPAS